LNNPLSISTAAANIKTLALIIHALYTPPPQAAEFMTMFVAWPSLETLEVVNGAHTSDMGNPIEQIESALPHAGDLVPIIPHPDSKLRKLVIRGNIMMMVAGLRALQAPLETLCLYDIQVYFPEYMLKALWIVGKTLKTLSLGDRDGLMSKWGPFAEVFRGLNELIPNVETLEFDSLDFPEGISGSGILPPRLKRLVVTREKALGTSQVLRLLDEVINVDGLTELEEVQWFSYKFEKSSWERMGIRRLEDWGMAHSVRIDARHYKH
jgi:hypothetical protein